MKPLRILSLFMLLFMTIGIPTFSQNNHTNNYLNGEYLGKSTDANGEYHLVKVKSKQTNCPWVTVEIQYEGGTATLIDPSYNGNTTQWNAVVNGETIFKFYGTFTKVKFKASTICNWQGQSDFITVTVVDNAMPYTYKSGSFQFKKYIKRTVIKKR